VCINFWANVTTLHLPHGMSSMSSVKYFCTI